MSAASLRLATIGMLATTAVVACTIKTSDECGCDDANPSLGGTGSRTAVVETGGTGATTGVTGTGALPSLGGADSGGAGGASGTVVQGGSGGQTHCATPEICGNHVDDDCDGAVDETPCREGDACSFQGTSLPQDQGWSVTAAGMESPPASVTVEVDGNALHLKDTGTTSGTWLAWGKDCFTTLDTRYTYVAEFQVKATSCSDYGGFLVALGSGTNRVELTLFPEQIQVGGSQGCESSVIAAPLAELTTLRLELTPGGSSPDSVKIFVNGTEKGQATPCAESRYDVAFGLNSANSTAEGLVKEIHAWREMR